LCCLAERKEFKRKWSLYVLWKIFPLGRGGQRAEVRGQVARDAEARREEQGRGRAEPVGEARQACSLTQGPCRAAAGVFILDTMGHDRVVKMHLEEFRIARDSVPQISDVREFADSRQQM
jgi:hypothetical protein